MKSIIALALLASGAAQAFDFAAATDGTYTCPSYCVGFTTSDPAYSVQYVNIQLNDSTHFKVTLSVNGKVYQGLSLDPIANAVLQASDGTQVQASVAYNYTRTCTHSGRGQTCTSRWHATGGTITP